MAMLSQLSDLLDRWIESTAWEMTPPASYGAFHLIFSAVSL